jgi:hypothetical protein
VVAAIAIATALFTAPWRPNPETIPVTYAGRGEFFAQYDAGLWIYMLSWGARQPDRFYDAPILMPLRNPMVANDPRLTESFWSIPIFRAFDPVTAWGITTWIALFTTAVAAYYSGRLLAGSAWGGAAFAILFAFGTFRANHVCHIEGLFAPFLPLVPAALEYSYTAIALVSTIPIAILWGARRRHIPSRFTALALGVFLAATAISLAPVAAHYAKFNRETEFQRPRGEIDIGGADVEAWLTGPDGRLLPPFGGEGAFLFDLRLFPGFVMLGLGFAGLGFLRKRTPELLAVGFVGFLLTFGTMRLLFWSSGFPYWDLLTPYEYLLRYAFPFRAIRAPGRFAMIPHLVLAVAGALAVARWAERGKTARIATVLLLALSFIECRLGMHEAIVRPERAGDPAYAWVGAQPGDFAVLDAPMGFTGPGEYDLTEVHALTAALEHGKSTPNGAMAMQVPWHLSIQQHVARPRPTETPLLLRAFGIRYVVARDSSTAGAFERIGLRRVFDSPRGSRVFEVDSPLPVPQTPAELQERLFEFPHSRHLLETRPPSCRIEVPRKIEVSRGRSLNIPVIVTNTGSETWCAGGAIFGGGPRGDVIALVRRWEILGGGAAALDGAAAWNGAATKGGAERRPLGLRGKPLTGVGYLPADCAPGESCPVTVHGRPPRERGLYRVWIDLCAADIQWFHSNGEEASSVLVEVK